MAKMNKIDDMKMIDKIIETKTWFLEKTKNIDKTLIRWTKRKREKAQITKIRNEGVLSSPMVRTSCFHCRGHRFDPWMGIL